MSRGTMTGALLLSLSIAFAHLRVRVRQTIIAVAGVAVGVGFFLAVSAMMIGSQMDFIRTLVDAAPHIIVQDEQRASPAQPAAAAFPGAAVEFHGLRTRDEVRGLRNWAAMLADVRAERGVMAAAALQGGVAVKFAGRSEAASLTGIDPRIEDSIVKINKDMIGGTLGSLENVQNGLIISKEAATRLNVKLGDTVIVSAASGAVQRARVVAFIDSDARAGSQNIAYSLLRTAQVLFNRPNIVNQLHVRVEDPQDAQRLAAALEARWGYKWESWQERSRDILNALVVRNIIMYAVGSAILLVASFGVYTVISTNVAEKRRDIAILRAIGFSDSDVTGVFLIEGVALALLGAVVGFALGAGLMEALAATPFKIQGKVYHIPLDRGLHQYLIAGGASLVSATLAAFAPARRAALLNPVDILRGAA